jgi:hypothetical protein
MTTITDQNIHELVIQYIGFINGIVNVDKLPEDLIDVQIGDWDVSRVTNMDFLFEERSFDEPIGGWDVSNVTSMEGMFKDTATFNQPIGGWIVSNVTNMAYMFAGASGSFNQPIGGWDVSSVKNMEGMFADTGLFNQPIGGWDVSSVENMASMFENTESFNQPIGGWDVSRVENMNKMFHYALAFNQPIGNWNVSNVISMNNMFLGAEALINNPLGQWNARRVRSNVAIARTTEEYMAMCLTADKTADECMESECPSCLDKFIVNGHLLRPVMFHKTVKLDGNEIWSCPVHPEEQVKWGQHRGECSMCRQKVFIPTVQKDDIMREAHHRKAATKIQSMTRGHMSRKKPKSGGKKRSNRRKHVKHNKMTRKWSRMHKKMH